MGHAVVRLSAIVLAVLSLVSAVLEAQQSKSAALATELTRLLDERNLDSIAAKHARQDRFVAALYFPGSQLLVVSGRFSAPDRVQYLLGKHAYRDVYLDLNGAAEPHSKILVSDLGANGLRFSREENQPFDMVDLPGLSVAFNGQWGRSTISEADYRKAFDTADDEYAQMLQSLIDALKKPS